VSRAKSSPLRLRHRISTNIAHKYTARQPTRCAMPSDEAQAFYHDVYTAIQQIPYGRVTTYSHIANLTGYPKRPRQVGVCLKYLPSFDPAEPSRHFFHGDNVPWQRVVNSKGGISFRDRAGSGSAGGLTPMEEQKRRLRAEGVEVNDDTRGEESWVDLQRWGWFPPCLPGEESEGAKGQASG